MEQTESARKVLQFVRPGSTTEFPQETERQLDRALLVNRLNYLNFQDGTLLVNFRHNKYSQIVSLEARPLPCQDDWLDCSWVDSADVLQKIASATFEDLFIMDGHRVVVVHPTVTGITENGISFRLPDKASEMSYRKVKRHLCQGVRAQLMQNSAIFHGTLLDFSSVSFRIEVDATPPQTFQWIDPQQAVSVLFSRGGETHFSGTCHVIKHNFGGRSATLVLEPCDRHRPRFRPKTYRSTRQSLAPSPSAVFRHPFTGKTVHLKVHDISGIGFSVEEETSSSVLPPGLIIPELELGFANTFSTMVRAQVVYREPCRGDEGMVRCGLTILNMEVQDHVNLLSLLYQQSSGGAYLCHKIDMEKLWQFFFESGYIAPQKYLSLKGQKEAVRVLYHKLYCENPRLARQFVYEEKGALLGHMALIRCYENSWLLDHDPARNGAAQRAPLEVLSRIGSFVNDSHRLFSMHMDYLFCYYQPQEEFAQQAFGGIAAAIGDRKGCSVDAVARLHFVRQQISHPSFSDNWQLAAATAEDLRELESFYENDSGGLLLEALQLDAGSFETGHLSDEYREAGFSRERRLFCLRKRQTLVAVVAVLLSDVGFTLLESTNSLHVFVLCPGELNRKTLDLTLSILLTKFRKEEMPVFLYPQAFAALNDLETEPAHHLWVLSMQHTDHCLGYLEKLQNDGSAPNPASGPA